MHAIQPVTPIQPALPRHRRSPSQTSPTRRTQRYRTTAIELTVKLTTNLEHPIELSGETVLPGFILNLRRIWR